MELHCGIASVTAVLFWSLSKYRFHNLEIKQRTNCGNRNFHAKWAYVLSLNLKTVILFIWVANMLIQFEKEGGWHLILKIQPRYDKIK